MTAVGVESQITEALFERLRGLTLSPAVPVAWPDTEFPGKDVSGAEKAKPDLYFEVHQLRADPAPIGISAWDDRAGILQVDVVSNQFRGQIKPTQYADQIAAHFPRNLKLPNGSVRVDIIEPPAIAAPISDAPYSRTPVSIRYRCFTR